MPAVRTFLFLQGLPGSYFRHLGEALAERGHRVLRVNFCAGDRLFWGGSKTINFRAPPTQWPETVARLLVEHGVTDIVMFGDCRPIHRAAIRAAADSGAAVHIVEEGYLRPDWVTFEAGGVNGYSSLPRNPDWFLAEAAPLPELQKQAGVPSSLARRAVDVISYNLANTLLWWLYPRYRTHRPWHPAVEGLGWLRRFVRRGWLRVSTASKLPQQRLQFLFPLQLDCDTQIRVHSDFGRMHRAIELVLQSFATHAPTEATLVIKEHPHDNGLTDWRKLITSRAANLGIADRVVHLANGDITRLVNASTGVVTINSTTGGIALANGVPVLTLAQAVYNMPGLTHQNGLDSFWHTPQAPDPVLYKAFRRVLIARCLVRGDLFSLEGQRLLVETTVARLEKGASSMPLSPSAVPARATTLAGFGLSHAPALHS